MRKICFTIACLGTFSWGLMATSADQQPAAPAIDFEQQVKPIFAAKCLDCHGESDPEGRLRLDRKSSVLRGGDSGEPAIQPGNSAQSHLVRLITGQEAGKVMPPEGNDRLSPEEIALIKAWIDQGASWPGQSDDPAEKPLVSDHWSFQPLAAFAVPSVAAGRVQNPIDAFIQRQLQEHQLQPSPPADRRVLIRRMFLDVLGMPPTPEQVAEYLNDSSAAATQHLIERLLGSQQYGERQAGYWLDLVRFAETHGFETNRERPNAWHYRDYVIESFNADKPYDQFVKEQLAGDSFGNEIALGYLVAGAFDLVKSPDINLTLMQRQNELDDMINTTSTAFLGLTVGCARCHNHKFDPITQADYYAMQAVFAGVNHGDKSLPLPASQAEQVATLQSEIAALTHRIDQFPRPGAPTDLLLIDDDPLVSGSQVEHLKIPAGTGTNPNGRERGQKNDPGESGRPRNLSGGSYTWWLNQPGQPVCSWAPQLSGKFHLWLSWGCGFETHSQDARYVIDHDGDPATSDDWEEVARVNQRNFADQQTPTTKQALWSGLMHAGVVTLEPHQKLLLVGGDTGTALTADAVLFETATAADEGLALTSPRLRDAARADGTIEQFSPLAARSVRFVIESTNSGQPCLDELEVFSGGRNVALAATGARATASGSLQGYPIHALEHVNDGRYGNNFSWISNEPSRGWVQIQFPQLELIDRIVWARDREGRFQDRMPVGYRIEVSEEGTLWRTISSSNVRFSESAANSALALQFDFLPGAQAAEARQLVQQLEAAKKRLAEISAAPQVYAGNYTQPGPTHRLFRGEPMMPREQVGPGAPEVLAHLELTPETPEKDRRRALAEWIVSAENPLAARVMVNRLWQQHFGRGLVDTPSDFGAAGSVPTHPELLDWLALQLTQQNWSLKEVHRLILNSATYQQSSLPVAAAMQVDAACQLLWRFPPRRLEAEPIRDSILEVSGVLDLTPGGPGFSLFEIEAENVRHYYPKTSFGPADWRRMIYMTKVRMEKDSVFGVFDCPDAATSVPRRTVSTTPLQALNLFNSTFLLQQADLFAQRLTRDAPASLPDQLQRAYALCFSRDASPEELNAAEAFVKEHGLPAFCRALLNSNEFLFIQ